MAWPMSRGPVLESSFASRTLLVGAFPMRRFRFSIASLMTLVVFVAVSLAALRYVSPLWARALFSITWGILLAAVIGIIYRDGRRRAFWVGFALFGFGYLALSFGPWASAEVRPHLITTALLNELYPRMHPESGSTTATTILTLNPVGSTSTTSTATAPGTIVVDNVQTSANVFVPVTVIGNMAYALTALGASASSSEQAEQFQRVGHALFVLLMAGWGGMIARLAYETRENHRDEEATP
jgi:hypothetical protein